MERKMPTGRSTSTTSARGVCALKVAHSANARPDARLLTISVALKPNLRIKRVVKGLMPMFPTKIGIMTKPARRGLHPNASWNSRGNRNGAAAFAIRNSEPPSTITRNVRIRSTCNCRSG